MSPVLLTRGPQKYLAILFGFEMPAHLNACHVGKRDVEEDNVGMAGSHGIPTSLPSSGLTHLISFVDKKGW
jgi:hypothetical protein